MTAMIHDIHDMHGIHDISCISLATKKCNENFLTHLVNSFFENLQDHSHPLIRVTLLHERNTGNSRKVQCSERCSN